MNRSHTKWPIISLLSGALLLGTQPLLGMLCNSGSENNVPNIRYVDNEDYTITDKQTGLMWKQCAEGYSTTTDPCDTAANLTENPVAYNWLEAHRRAQDVNAPEASENFNYPDSTALGSEYGYNAGYTDWRVPNRQELVSLRSSRCNFPSINSTLFPSTGNAKYWTSTPYSISYGQAHIVDFKLGETRVEAKSNLNRVRLVRDNN